MHRIDTPTAQADKFGPGKNGFTNGDPATGRRATDLNSDMWDAVQEEVCAVIEKSGLALNKDQHDQLYQAIVKIITSKIPDALLKKNNLSDLADKALARANLELKSAAQKEVVTSLTDKTAGRVPVVGWMGLGVDNSGSGCPISGGIDYVSEPTGIWQATNELTTGTFPPNTSHYGTLFRMRGSANDVSQLYFPGASVANGGNIYFRQYNAVSQRWGNWYKIYSEFSKPTADEVGALPITGGTLTGLLTLSNATPYIALRATGSDTRRYIMGFNSDGSSSFYVGKANAGSESCMLWNYTPGSGLEINGDGRIIVNCKGKSSVFNTDGTFVPAAWTNFDARYQAKGNYTPAGQAYTKAESDGKYQLKGNYALVGASYTKAESDARFGVVNAMRRGGQQHKAGGNWIGAWEAPAGCYMTGLNSNEGDDGRKMGIYYRQQQYFNRQTNAWVNMGD
ncbi:pyocin knob domain-containing protein [Enterobacter mori]